jgi:hypothetical protein
MTITPQPSIMTVAHVAAAFEGRPLNDAMFAQVRAVLKNLRAWDDYERCTTEERQRAKAALRRILDRQP